MIVATNGFMPEHLDPALHGRVLPLISAIVVTRPLSAEELAAQGWRTECPVFTYQNLLNYFRLLPDGRFLFGGRGSATGSESSAERNYERLIARLRTLFPVWESVDIDYRWHGLVCMTRRLTPALGTLEDDDSVFFAFGYHGNGVNTATWAGWKISQWLADGTGPPDGLPDVTRGLPARFPFAGARLAYVQAIIAGLRLADRWN